MSVLHLGCRCCFLIRGTDLFLMSGGDAVGVTRQLNRNCWKCIWSGSFVFVWGRWQSVLRSTTKGRGDRIDKLSTIHNMSRVYRVREGIRDNLIRENTNGLGTTTTEGAVIFSGKETTKTGGSNGGGVELLLDPRQHSPPCLVPYSLAIIPKALRTEYNTDCFGQCLSFVWF